MVHVEDAFTTATSVNPQRYPEVYKMLLAYPKGHPLVVPYYHRVQSDLDVRSTIVDFAWEEDAIHSDLEKIVDLEMRLDEQLQTQNLEEDRSADITGTAIMYPGMEPFVGDIFLMEIDNKMATIFIINKVEPTTFRQERYYRVSFSSSMKLDKQAYERLETRVTRRLHFVKKKYFGESELTFLNEDSYNQLRTIEHYRRSIAQDFVNFFFDRDAQSFFRPDGIYDPYVTEFLRSKISVRENGIRAVQLVVPLVNYNRTIWYKFISAENCSNFSDLYAYAVLRYKDPKYMTADCNGLTGKYYLDVVPGVLDGFTYPNTQEPKKIASSYSRKDPLYPHLINDKCTFPPHRQDYLTGYTNYEECPVCSSNGSYSTEHSQDAAILSSSFYNNTLVDGDGGLEIIIKNYLLNKGVNVEAILEQAQAYRSLGTTVNAYYRMAFYLELLDAAAVAIK